MIGLEDMGNRGWDMMGEMRMGWDMMGEMRMGWDRMEYDGKRKGGLIGSADKQAITGRNGI